MVHLSSSLVQMVLWGVQLWCRWCFGGFNSGALVGSTLVQGCLSPRLMGELLPKAGPRPLAPPSLLFPSLLQNPPLPPSPLPPSKLFALPALNVLLISPSSNICNGTICNLSLLQNILPWPSLDVWRSELPSLHFVIFQQYCLQLLFQFSWF